MLFKCYICNFCIWVYLLKRKWSINIRKPRKKIVYKDCKLNELKKIDRKFKNYITKNFKRSRNINPYRISTKHTCNIIFMEPTRFSKDNESILFWEKRTI